MTWEMKVRLVESVDYALDSGAANAYAISLDPAPEAYTAGLLALFKAANANSGASTLNVNLLGAKTIKKWSSGSLVDLASGDITIGQIIPVVYDGTNFQIVGGTGGGGSSLPDPVTPAHGGTGLATLTAHAVLVGEGTSNVAEIGPGTSNYPLLGGGGSADPAFQQPRGNTSVVQLADSTTNPTSGDLASFDANGNVKDSGILASSVITGSQPYTVISWVEGRPNASENLLVFKLERAITFAANFSGSKGRVGTNPAATATYNVNKNGSSIGTIQISTGGAFTFATTGGAAQSLAAGDELAIVAPSSQDTALADVGITLSATR